jgi:hypothetical protein
MVCTLENIAIAYKKNICTLDRASNGKMGRKLHDYEPHIDVGLGLEDRQMPPFRRNITPPSSGTMVLKPRRPTMTSIKFHRTLTVCTLHLILI